MEATSIDKSQLTVEDNGDCRIPAEGAIKPQEVGSGPTSLYFTYSVQWISSEVSWASRWDIYLGMTDVQIHWFSIFNSLVVVLFLFGEFNFNKFQNLGQSTHFLPRFIDEKIMYLLVNYINHFIPFFHRISILQKGYISNLTYLIRTISSLVNNYIMCYSLHLLKLNSDHLKEVEFKNNLSFNNICFKVS